jgi:hypothetical protein
VLTDGDALLSDPGIEAIDELLFTVPYLTSSSVTGGSPVGHCGRASRPWPSPIWTRLPSGSRRAGASR